MNRPSRVVLFAVSIVTVALQATAAIGRADQQLLRRWATYASKDGPYSVSFPQQATPTGYDDAVTWRGQKLPGQAYRVREADRQWSVLRVKNVTYPALTTRERRMAQALDAYAEWVRDGLGTSGGRMLSVSPVNLDRHPGRHMVMTVSSGNTIERRVFLLDSVLYVLEFAMAAGANAGLDADMFFGSFRLAVPIGAIELRR